MKTGDGPRDGSAHGHAAEVFISHGGRDALSAERVHAELHRRDIAAWMASKDQVPGEAWLQAIEVAARRATAALILLGRIPLPPWHEREVEALLILERERRLLATGRPLQIIPTLLPGAEVAPEGLPLFLRPFHVLDWRAGFSPRGFDDLGAAIKGQHPPGPVPPPRPSSRWRWWLLAAGALGSVAGALLLTVVAREKRPAPVNPDRVAPPGPPLRDGGAVTPDSVPRERTFPSDSMARPPTPRPDRPPAQRHLERPDPLPFISNRVVVFGFDYRGASEKLQSLAHEASSGITRTLTDGDCQFAFGPDVPPADDQAAVAIARQVRARYLLRGDIFEVGEQTRISARLLDAQTGSIVGVGSGLSGGRYFLAAEKAVADDLAKVLVDHRVCKPR